MNQLRMAVLDNDVLDDKRGKNGRELPRTANFTDVDPQQSTWLQP
jgi:hypothetical protein